MKKKIGIIGYGNWAKKIVPMISKFSKICFIADSRISYKLFPCKIDWVFVLSSNETHFEIVKYFLNRKINVFCEKPLTKSVNETKKLIYLSKINKVKLYINDIENYKLKKIQPSNYYRVVRKKLDKTFSKESILYRLTYHDLYLLHKKLENEQFDIAVFEKKYELKIILKTIGGIVFNFYYSLESIKLEHTINNINFLQFKGNPIEKMIKRVLEKKVNFKKNNLQAVFCNQIIEKINNEIK